MRIQKGSSRVVFLALALLLGGAAAGVAQPSCPTSKSIVESQIFAGATPGQLQAEYGGCVPTAGQPSPSFLNTPLPNGTFNAPSPTGQVITPTGNTAYEAITSCGYHPQRREFYCPIEIRQRFGFAGAPGAGPGSFEWVFVCVDYGDGLGLVPVNQGNVHIHDEAFGVQPNWYFGVLIPANARLSGLPLNGRTLKARAILSWAWPVNNCFGRPAWGNQADFRIRLDP